MRILIKLKLVKSKGISLNYNYPCSAAIYNLLRFGSSEFSEFLHSTGYKLEGKTYKLFSYALRFTPERIENGVASIKNNFATIYFSTPLPDSFISNLLIGAFTNNLLTINADECISHFMMEQCEIIPDPEFYSKMRFVCLSPLVLSTRKEMNGKLTQHHIEHFEDVNETNRIFLNNLINKYSIINNKDYTGEGLKFKWDEEYLNRVLARNQKPTRKVVVRKPGIAPFNIIGNNIPFFVEGDIELIKTGYDAGFGEKNSLGFGMAVPG
ncbi:MAG: CRISPR-associated endoribonuclease Cas6 [Ignavibacteriaceae bacterium]|nr:CRISPR-associated endoribonuclease Cas6 [Ignavibacteriaceae bacterium]